MDLSKHLEKAAEAVKRRNYGFAVNLYGQLLALQPDNGDARTGLRQALFKKAQAKPGGKAVAMLLGGVHLVSAEVARTLGRHGAAAKAYERYLVHDPLNEAVNLKLGRALQRAGHRHSALAVFRAYAEAEPKCLEAARSAGALLYEIGELQPALAMYEQALRIDPRDQESLKARKNLAAEGALRSTGIATAQSSHELIKDKEAQRKLERSSRLQLSGEEITSEMTELQEKLAQAPRDRALLRRMAELRELQGDVQGALEQLETALRETPNDAELQARAGDYRLRLQEQAVRDAQQRGDEGAAAKARGALAELRVTEMKRRVAAHPTDLTLRFELGSALLDVGQVDASIAELQQAVKDPRRKTDALVALGRAFRKKNLPELAHTQLTKALEAAGSTGDAGKAILYELASLAGQLGRDSEALAHYSRILEQDINYRDVARRIEDLKNTKT